MNTYANISLMLCKCLLENSITLDGANLINILKAASTQMKQEILADAASMKW